MSSPSSQKSLSAAKVNAILHIFTHSVRGTLLICFKPHLLLLLKGLKLGVSCHDIQFQIYHLQRLQSVSEWAKFLWLCSPCFSLRYAEWWRMDRKLLSIFSIPWHLNGAFIFPKDAIADICTQPWSSNIAICSEDQHDFRIFPLLSSLAFPVGSLGSAQIQFNLNQ